MSMNLDKLLRHGCAVLRGLAIASALGLAAATTALSQGLVIDGEQIGDEALLKAAQAEGDLLYYTVNLEDKERAALDVFKQDTGINFDVVRLNGSRMYERVVTEFGGNSLAADVVSMSDFVLMQDLLAKNVFTPHKVPSWDAIPAELKNPDGLYYVENRYAKVFGYNTQLLPEADAPKSWKALLDPKLKGRIGIQEANSGGIAWTTVLMQRQLVDPDYWQKLAANQPRLYTGLTQAAEDVARGELLVSEMLPVQGLTLLDAGAPIKLIFPEEGLPSSAILVGVTSTARHPNAAKLYVNWLMSKRGGAVIADSFKDWPSNPAAPVPNLDKYGITMPAATQLWEANKEDWVKLREPWLKEWEQVFRSGK